MLGLPARPFAVALIAAAVLAVAGCGGQPATNPPGTTVVTEWHVSGPAYFLLIWVLPALTLLATALFAWWLYRLIANRPREGNPEVQSPAGRPTTGSGKRLLVRVLVMLAVVWFGAQVLVTAVRFINGREEHQRAEAWLRKAVQDARPDMTPADAIRWLEQNGADSVGRGEKAWVNGQEVENHVIVGYRIVSRRSFWAEPLTAQLKFRFDSTWRFTNAELNCLRFEVH